MGIHPRLAHIEIVGTIVQCFPKELEECIIAGDYLFPKDDGEEELLLPQGIPAPTRDSLRASIILDLKRNALRLLGPCEVVGDWELRSEIVRQMGLKEYPLYFARRKRNGEIKPISATLCRWRELGRRVRVIK